MHREETASFLDITPFLAEGQPPQIVIPRRASDVWYARQQPIQFGKREELPDAWAMTKSGDFVRIPLIPYRTSSREPAEVVMAAMQIGQRIVASQPKILRIHLVVGTPIEDLEAVNAYRMWVGVAIQTH